MRFAAQRLPREDEMAELLNGYPIVGSVTVQKNLLKQHICNYHARISLVITLVNRVYCLVNVNLAG
jgi:hypothetical protein